MQKNDAWAAIESDRRRVADLRQLIEMWTARIRRMEWEVARRGSS